MKTDREICEAAIKECFNTEITTADTDFLERFKPGKIIDLLDEIWRWKGFFKQIRFVLGFGEEATCEQLTHAVEQLKAERDEVRGMYCHTLAYKEGTIHDKSSALEVARCFNWDCFEEQG